MTPSKTFRDVIAWQLAHKLVLEVYKYTSHFPREEMFGLTSQFRRASVSVAANIAEGFGKLSPRDKARFFNIAQGSLEECNYYILLANDLHFGENKPLEELADKTGKVLNAYCTAIRNKFPSRTS